MMAMAGTTEGLQRKAVAVGGDLAFGDGSERVIEEGKEEGAVLGWLFSCREGEVRICEDQGEITREGSSLLINLGPVFTQIEETIKEAEASPKANIFQVV
ncbi:uncharacterized protein A4U43_UnF11150 [Asparagus officinalis]|uniref:Uncharacterized protein n=1 Tax=Asparagus officinalis TaxID=4686 RepID=A0A1R3L5B5_ASPOF|nr:uncharacterized protein A4U43_UnF11150 [Asparagus officinalis]